MGKLKISQEESLTRDEDTKEIQNSMLLRVREANSYVESSSSQSLITTEVSTALSIYGTSLLRILSSHLSLSKSPTTAHATTILVDHTDLVVATLKGVGATLRKIDWPSSDAKFKEQINNSLPQLLAVVLEYLTPSISQTATQSTDEVFILTTMDTFQALLHLFKGQRTNVYEHHMKGSFLAQIIQSCLSLMQYPVKQIAIASIDLLAQLHVLTTFQDHRLCNSSPQENGPMPGYILWRNYYPGVFSSIFMLCCGKKGKVHGTVKVSAFCILLTITTSIIDDKIHFTLLQEFLQQQQHEATSSSNRLISSGAEFLKVLNIHATALDAVDSGNVEANGAASDESAYMKLNPI